MRRSLSLILVSAFLVLCSVGSAKADQTYYTINLQAPSPCLAGSCFVTATFTPPDPGVLYTVAFDLGNTGGPGKPIVPDVTTQCAAPGYPDPAFAGTVCSASSPVINNRGLYRVMATIQDASGSVWTDIRSVVAEGVADKKPVFALESSSRHVQSGKPFYVLTNGKVLVAGYTSNVGSLAGRFSGTAVASPAGTLNGLNRFKVVLYAPKGRLRLELNSAMAPGGNLVGRGRYYLDNTHSPRVSKGAFHRELQLKLGPGQFTVIGQMQYYAKDPSVNRVQVLVQRKQNERWVTVGRKTRNRTGPVGLYKYSAEFYTSRVVLGGARQAALKQQVCRGSGRYRVVASYGVRSKGRSITPSSWRKPLIKNLTRKLCPS